MSLSTGERLGPYEIVEHDTRLRRTVAIKVVRPDLAGRERDLGIQSFKDAARTVDCLATRGDIDMSKIAFSGVSSGAGLGLKIVAADSRFKAAVLLSLGYTPAGGFPVVDSWNYARRATIPILMLNGQDDSMASVKSAQDVMYEALGTPRKDKKHRVYPGGHVDFINRENVIKEAPDSLNLCLDPVNLHP